MYATLLASLKGDTRLCVARSLTTSDEWVATHTIAEWKNCPPLSSTSCPPCSCSWPADHAATFLILAAAAAWRAAPRAAPPAWT